MWLIRTNMFFHEIADVDSIFIVSIRIKLIYCKKKKSVTQVNSVLFFYVVSNSLCLTHY